MFSQTGFDDKDVFFLSLMTGLTLLNRMDTVLIVFPALTYACLKDYRRNKKRLLYLIPAGLSPFVLWEIFCIIYYGFPFPNSYYAKLQTGFPLSEYLIRGWRYYEYSFLFDTATLFGIAAGLAAMFYKPADGRFIAAGAGVVLYLLYIFYIGGDFMAGRFFALTFFTALFLFPYGKLSPGIGKTALTGIVCLAIPLICIHKRNLDMPYAYTPPACLLPWNTHPFCSLDEYEISSEKAFWKERISRFVLKNDSSGLKNFNKDLNDTHPVSIYETGGVIAFSRSRQHALDFAGITDALTARMPPVRYKDWKTGHIARLFPKGYKESLISGKNEIKDKEIAAYYDKLKEVVAAPLFSVGRFKTILELNTRKFVPPVGEWGILSKTPVRKMYEYQDLAQYSYGPPDDFKELVSLLDKTSLSDMKKHLETYDILMPFIAPILIDVEKTSRASSVLAETETWEDFPCEVMLFFFINTNKSVISGKAVPYSPMLRVDVPEKMKENGFDKIMMVKPVCKTEHMSFFTEAFPFKRFELAE